jgi:hypothetical protein
VILIRRLVGRRAAEQAAIILANLDQVTEQPPHCFVPASAPVHRTAVHDLLPVTPIPARQHHSAQTNQDAARVSTVDAQAAKPIAVCQSPCAVPPVAGRR